MVLLQTKNSKTPSSPLNQQSVNEKPLVSFADLLKGASSTKDAKVVQNAFVAPAVEHTTIKTEKISPKTEMLASLMKNEEKTASKSDVEFLELNPKVVATLSKEEIKELVYEAKNYLKAKIQESDGYKKAEIKELPTTLRGLIEVAKKFDIDIAKITFEEVRSNAKNIPQAVVQDDKKTEVQKEAFLDRKEFKAETPKEIVSEKKEFKSEMPKEVLSEKKELKTEAQKGLKPETQKAETPKEMLSEKKEPKIELPKEVKTDVQKELKPEIQKAETPKEIVLEKKEFKSETPKEIVSEKKELKVELLKDAKTEAQKEIKPETQKAEIPKEIVSEKKEPKIELPKEVKTEVQKELKPETQKAEIPKEIVSEKKEPKIELPKEVKTEVQKELKPETQKAEIPKEIVSEKKELKVELLKGPKTEAQKEIKPETQKAEIPKEIVSEKKEFKPEISKVETTKEPIFGKQQDVTIRSEALFKEEYREKTGSERFMEMPKELKELPLFKTETAVQHTTTEQIMQAKAGNAVQKTEQKAPKERADETLSLLLRGEKLSGENVSLTADFSVATAKVIAPTLGNENKSLEQLLKGESFAPQQNENSSANIESITTHKADSLEVKMNEAKQMIKYLSNDVKSAIDDYRSPFTRVKVQLNPQNLGEVDLTVVQRGKNLHVNISSNNTAIQTLSMNINELRVQLNNSGINNATFNFSSGSQSSDANANTGQQQRQNEQKAHQEYGYFEDEETHEEVLSSLEIIVPRYI